jgi:hypothetical protein
VAAPLRGRDRVSEKLSYVGIKSGIVVKLYGTGKSAASARCQPTGELHVTARCGTQGPCFAEQKQCIGDWAAAFIQSYQTPGCVAMNATRGPHRRQCFATIRGVQTLRNSFNKSTSGNYLRHSSASLRVADDGGVACDAPACLLAANVRQPPARTNSSQGLARLELTQDRWNPRSSPPDFDSRHF